MTENRIRKEPTIGPQGDAQTILGIGDLTLDAWGRSKAITDLSKFHGMFTHSIPISNWYESFNGVELATFDGATSVNSKMRLTSNGGTTKLQSFTHPRYEPNRGALYSISAFLPNKEAIGTRDFGIFTAESGAFFRLRDGKLYACRRTTVDAVTTTYEEEIENVLVDLEKGNIFDIQMQWRGVGNLFFYINDHLRSVNNLVHVMENVNKNTELSINNPSLPLAFECVKDVDDVVIECGCVDITSEGGTNESGTYGSISTTTKSGSVKISGYNQLIVAVRSLKEFNSLINTRGIKNLTFTGYADQRSLMRIWTTRDVTAISDGTQLWTPFREGNLEYIEHGEAGTEPTIDIAKAELQFTARIDQDQSFSSSAVFNDITELLLTPGDIIIFTMHRENGLAVNAGVTYEFAEAI